MRADRPELIVVDSHAAHDPRQGSYDDDGSDTASSDQYRCEHGAVSIWRTREDFKLLLWFNRRLTAWPGSTPSTAGGMDGLLPRGLPDA